ncbi:MAG: class I SAM-dependent methyltransferase, partial [Planctomycetota bacterium]
WLDARAEALPLPDAGFELALAAQAFHWFEPGAALREIARVLVPGGRLALLWNVRDLTDAATAEYSDVVARGAQRAREEAFHLWPEELAGSGSFDACWERSFAHAQELDADGLIGRARSASYVPLAAAELATALREFHARRADAAGRVAIRYRTRLYLAERRRGGGAG